MAKQKAPKHSAFRAGKGTVSLDHWVGHMQHTADGRSTDPKTREGWFEGPKRQGGEEAGGAPEVEIE